MDNLPETAGKSHEIFSQNILPPCHSSLEAYIVEAAKATC